MAIVRDLKTGEFMEIPDKDAKKFVIPAEKVRETLTAAGIGGPEGGGPAPEGGFQGPLPNLVLNLNLNELLARGAGQPMMPQMMPPQMPQMPMPQMAHAGGPPMPGPGGPHGPRVAPQWWVGPLGGVHPGHPGWGWHHPYYGGWHYGW